MTHVRYARPRLITADDKHYRAFVEQFLIQRRNQRAIRPPRQRDIFGGQAEAALRDWLATRFALSERRILEYEERRGNRASMKYRELDALLLEDAQSAWVFEIKASRSAGSLRRALAQLQETRSILRLLYPVVRATILLVDTGIPSAADVAALMAAPEAPAIEPQTLAQILATLPDIHCISDLAERSSDQAHTDLLRFGVADIIALVGAEKLALNWEADDELEDRVPPAESGPFYTTTDADQDDEDDNPMATALRRAGLT